MHAKSKQDGPVSPNDAQQANQPQTHPLGDELKASLSSDSRERTKALLNPRAVADRAGFKSCVTVLRAFRRRELPGYKLGPRVVRFDPDDVEKWLAAARVG